MSDVIQVKTEVGQPVTASNFREDINCNGAINAGDVIQPKLISGTFLPLTDPYQSMQRTASLTFVPLMSV